MKKVTQSEFLKRARYVHGDRYCYDNVVYVNMRTNVFIGCYKHGIFQQTPSNHLKGHGCTLCNKFEARRLSFSAFLEKSHRVHGNMYDYSKVVYINSKTKVEIVCPIHGSFWQQPEKHFIGHGCPLCVKNLKDTTESFINKARVVHGDLYDYSLVEYIDQKTKVHIIDPQYGDFWQSPNAHLNGEGCPRRACSKYSKPQLKMEVLLKQKFGEDDVLSEYISDVYPFHCDFYIKSLDLYIELNAFWTHGGHWFDPSSPDDILLLKVWQKKAETSSLYRTAVKTWTDTDVQKRTILETSGLNYIVFWDTWLSDFFEWYDSI